MKYIIHSKSERGFWHNKMGWVYRASTATKYTAEQKDNYRLPIGKDVEWIVFEYSE